MTTKRRSRNKCKYGKLKEELELRVVGKGDAEKLEEGLVNTVN